MKRICTSLYLLFTVLSTAAIAQDRFLLPDNYFAHKGDAFKVHLVEGSQFQKTAEIGLQKDLTATLAVYKGGKKFDQLASAKDGVKPLIQTPLDDNGLWLAEMVSKPVASDINREDFALQLESANLGEAAQKVKDLTQFTIRNTGTYYLKTLISVDKNSGSGYDKILGHEYEIVLKQNPYKLNYGDDITAVLYYKGKPLRATLINLFVKTASGAVFPQQLSTDENGQVYFKVSREGLYMLQSVHVKTIKDDEYETTVASYNFAFSSTNSMPDTYKEFGFGDKH